MDSFEIGDRVRWVHAVFQREKQDAEGIIVAVYPADCGMARFDVYDIEFRFGVISLYGTQIKGAQEKNGQSRAGIAAYAVAAQATVK